MSGPLVAVVGAVNLDISGKPFRPLVPRDSNPGTVTTSLGGVGRNIAHNMALLGLSVSLITALGCDSAGDTVAGSCRDLGIDLSHALRLPGRQTSTYLVLTDHRGEMELAVSDMGIYDHLTAEDVRDRLDFLNTAALVVADANLTADALAALAQGCAVPLFAEAVSTAKAVKLRGILPQIHTLKVNRLEAAVLSGVDIVDDVSLQLAANGLLDAGVGRVFITLGPDGALAAQRGQLVRLPIFPGEMKNATGCGDAFMAALAWAFLEGLGLEDSARAGLAAAALALAGEETINPALSAAGVRELARR